jgi:flagellin-specific chaperone FliS
VERDPGKIDDVIKLLSELREAWQQIAANPPAAVAAA